MIATDGNTNTESKINIFLLIFICFLPFVFTFISFNMEYYPKLIYTIGKIILIGIPIIVWKSSGIKFGDLPKTIGIKRTNCFYGFTTGIAIATLIITSYYFVFQEWIDPTAFYAKLSSLEIIPYFWILAVFISLWNSFIEEYYWRSFILGKWQAYFKSIVFLCILNGCLFSLHHFVILNSYFSWKLALFFTIGTAVGGGLWSWLRLQKFSIIDCYISHFCADIAIMWVGWDMITKMPA